MKTQQTTHAHRVDTYCDGGQGFLVVVLLPVVLVPDEHLHRSEVKCQGAKQSAGDTGVKHR